MKDLESKLSVISIYSSHSSSRNVLLLNMSIPIQDFDTVSIWSVFDALPAFD